MACAGSSNGAADDGIPTLDGRPPFDPISEPDKSLSSKDPGEKPPG